MSTMNRMKQLLIILTLFVSFVSVSTGVASAKTCEPASSVLGIPTWYKYLDGEDVAGKCRPIIRTQADGASKNLQKFLPIGLAFLEILLTLGGLVAVVMVLIGSVKFVITQGESEKAAGARKTVINAMIGLVIIIISTRVVSFIAGTLG